MTGARGVVIDLAAAAAPPTQNPNRGRAGNVAACDAPADI